MPEMAYRVGIDCAANCTKHAQAIRAAGVDYVGRYYRWPSSKYPPLSYAEAAQLSSAGLSIVALWEWASDKIDNFSYHEGFDQGSSAYKQAMNAHQPAQTPIYFAADADFSATQIAGPINDYFMGVKDAFAAISRGQASYTIGVYGSGRCCKWLLDHGRTARSWLAMSTGYAGFHTFKEWDVKQAGKDFKISGLKGGAKGDYDSDDAKSTLGDFTVT